MSNNGKKQVTKRGAAKRSDSDDSTKRRSKPVFFLYRIQTISMISAGLWRITSITMLTLRSNVVGSTVLWRLTSMTTQWVDWLDLYQDLLLRRSTIWLIMSFRQRKRRWTLANKLQPGHAADSATSTSVDTVRIWDDFFSVYRRPVSNQIEYMGDLVLQKSRTPMSLFLWSLFT